MDGRRKAIRRFTRLALAAGLILTAGATAAKAEASEGWVDEIRQTIERGRGNRDRPSDAQRERRKRRADLQRDSRKDGIEGGHRRAQRLKEWRKNRAQELRQQRSRRWREPDPPERWPRRRD